MDLKWNAMRHSLEKNRYLFVEPQLRKWIKKHPRSAAEFIPSHKWKGNVR